MNVFGIVDTAILVLLGLHNVKTRSLLNKKLSKISQWVIASHLSQKQETPHGQ